MNLVDYSVGGFPLLIIGVLELIAINWIYGKKFVNFKFLLQCLFMCLAWFRDKLHDGVSTLVSYGIEWRKVNLYLLSIIPRLNRINSKLEVFFYF